MMMMKMKLMSERRSSWSTEDADGHQKSRSEAVLDLEKETVSAWPAGTM